MTLFSWLFKSSREALLDHGFKDPHRHGAVGDGYADDGPAFRSAIGQSATTGGGLILRADGRYKIGPDSNRRGLDLSDYAAFAILGARGVGWIDDGSYGTSLFAGAERMTLLHQGGNWLNHSGTRVYGLNLSNRDGHADVLLDYVCDANHWRRQEVNYLGHGYRLTGLRVDTKLEGGDNAYAVLDQAGFSIDGSDCLGVDLVKGFGIRFRDGNFDMGEHAMAGVRIGPWYQEAQFRGTKWNHDGHCIISEGGRLNFSDCEFEITSPEQHGVVFSRREGSSPFSGQAIRFRDANLTGNSGDELGLYVGPGVTGVEDGCMYSNLRVQVEDRSDGGWQVGRRL